MVQLVNVMSETNDPEVNEILYESPATIPLTPSLAAEQQRQLAEQAAEEVVPEEPAEPPIVKLTKVCKWFTDARTKMRVDVLKNFKLEVKKKGEFLVLLGPSGCGKSTVLSMISGLQLPDSGVVEVFGNTITGPTPEAATVPQAYTCFPWRTAVENVEFGLCITGMPRKQRREVAIEYLSKVGLEDRAHAYPKQLSGGMQQRVAIARTLAMKLPIVLMDEPFGALDAQTRADMQQMLLQLWEEEKNNIIFVTHDITEALMLGDRVLVFPPRPVEEDNYFVSDDLNSRLGKERPPSLVREESFLQLYDELLAELKKKPHRPPAPEEAEPSSKSRKR
ncbi:MAG: ABC transporter ATP-binding protein [Pyrinomonadaceae bacterium]|nr:ABC transporter ATP-binding protein [Pyrinomonadaceae bacterium]